MRLSHQHLHTAFRDWAAMARLPNVPTVWSNVFTAWALTCGVPEDFFWSDDFIHTLVAFTFLYIGGTVMNDAHDVGYDRLHRPERPIPAGRVPGILATLVAALLLGVGTLMLLLLGKSSALILLAFIFIYTQIHKAQPVVGGIFMGLCRFILALSAYDPFVAPHPDRWECEGLHFGWALALLAYICSISWVAMGETKPWRRRLVGLMLPAIPLLDAAFILGASYVMPDAQRIWVLTPLACALMAWASRQVASAT
jgi:4-hydroxybenzoate polyprenyltransferase